MFDGQWVDGQVSTDLTRYWFVQEKWSMTDEGKRRVTCYATSTSMCYATSAQLMPRDDVSCHFIVYISCHISIVSTSAKRWSIGDGLGSMRFTSSFGFPREFSDG
jgi:hypothetical protein